MTRTRHVATIDTREQVFVEGKGWRGTPGTGEALPCHCCGRSHEVHALLIDERDSGMDASGMRRGWSKIRDLNYGVSCAKRVATVHAGSVLRQTDRATFDLLIVRARLAA